MKNKNGLVSQFQISLVFGLTAFFFTTTAFADQQTVEPSETSFQASPGDTISFTVGYTSASPTNITGLGVILYYDSSKLSFSGLSDVFSQSKISEDEGADSNNGDGNSSTDRRVNVAWASLSGGWPGSEGGVDLYTVTFVAAEGFSSDTTLSFTGDAAAGNSFASTPVSVTYKDTVAPTITAPANVSKEATGAVTSVTQAELGSPSVSDNIDASPTVSYSPHGPFSVGAHTITWVATDSSGSSASATQTLTIVDSIAPQITAPGNISTPATSSLTAVTLGSPTVIDAVDSNPVVSADNYGPFALGAHTVTWTAADASGNQATAVQTVTITSPGAPTLNSPADIIVEATGPTTEVTLPNVIGNDVIDGQLTATADKSNPFAVGAHTVTWSVTNSQNETTTATQTITVTDTTGPQILVPADVAVAATGATTTTTVDVGTATANDLVDGNVPVSSNANAAYPVGTHTVTWTATDGSNNTSTATQTIIVSDGEGPTITAPDDITVEATGITTEVSLGEATASDAVDGDLVASADKLGPFTVGVHTITWSVTDSANNVATATQLVTITDTSEPEILVSAEALKLDATGVLTPIPSTGVTVNDLVDPNPTVQVFTLANDVETEVPTAGLPSGRYQLLWKVTDSGGNVNTATQALEITPQANFVATQAASAGDEVLVNAELSGPALEYPVSIPYSIDTQASTVTSGDHDASNGVITINSGTAGSFTFNVSANPQLNGSGTGNLVFTMGTLSNAVTGSSNSHRVIISASNIPPVVKFEITQGGERISTVAKDAGKVIITAQASDSPSQTLSYDWGKTDNALTDLTTDNNAATFEFDPENLTVGNSYRAVVTVSDNGSPLEQTTIATQLEVSAGNSSITDSDGDGIVDSEDQIPEPNRLPAVYGNTYVMESEAGTALKLGETALQQKQHSATVDPDRIQAIPSQYENSGFSIYDFEITGVAQGETVLIVIPLNSAIPENAEYLKYNGESWQVFVQDNNNELYSAKGNSNGNCPSVSSEEYIQGLKAGDFCVQLKLQDGGSNDTDGAVNGQIADPGTVVGIKSDVKEDTDDRTPAATSGGGVVSWSLILPLWVISFIRRRRVGRL